MTVSKGDLIQKLAETCGLTDKDATNGVDAILSMITATASAGHKVIIRGFGTFEVKHKPARTARNMHTGLPVEVPARDVLTFKAAKTKA